jgi:transcription termination factor Rho
MELQLDRQLANKRIFPAVNLMASSTRRDDLLLPPTTSNRMWVLRNFLSQFNNVEAMQEVIKQMDNTLNNEEMLITMGS